MSDPMDRRKRRFADALKRRDETMQAWATRHGVTYTHLFYVLRGDRVSPRLEEAIEETIRNTETVAA